MRVKGVDNGIGENWEPRGWGTHPLMRPVKEAPTPGPHSHPVKMDKKGASRYMPRRSVES